jgi:hypothetical protein
MKRSSDYLGNHVACPSKDAGWLGNPLEDFGSNLGIPVDRRQLWKWRKQQALGPTVLDNS